MKDSWLDVHLCREGSPGCEVSNSTSKVGILKFPKLSTEERVKFKFCVLNCFPFEFCETIILTVLTYSTSIFRQR